MSVPGGTRSDGPRAPRCRSWSHRVPRRCAAALLLIAASTGLPIHTEAQDVPATATSPGERLPVRAVTLDNGLRLLVLPRTRSPTVSFVMQFRVGGVNEHLGNTGIAHLLEHLLFKGSTTIGTRDHAAELPLFARMDATHDTLLAARSHGDDERVVSLRERITELEDSARSFVVANEFDRLMTSAGARGLNATTASEATTYFVELPASRAELFFALEADRLAHPVFREFYTERDVVLEERRLRVDTSPGGLLYEAHLATAFTLHPYGVPVVGYLSDLETLRRQDVAAYYRDYYAPGNAVLAVVGDVDPDQVVAWAEQYLGPVGRGKEPPPVLAVEPPQRGERRIEIEWDAQPRLRIGWHVPAAISDEAPALAILSTLLSGGRTSRLHRRLVMADRTATAVFTSMGPGARYPQLFQIDATPRAPHTTAELEAAIYEEIARLATEGPAPIELERVRNQISAGAIRRLQSNLGLALQIAESEATLGDWRATFRSNKRLRAVTPEQVRAVAARYLVASNRTVATLVPESER